MVDQLLLLAESGSGGVPAAGVGIGAFVFLMALLGVTWLTSGANQRRSRSETDDSGTDH
ncbi:MAG TPA: hypothetical protein H9837_04680 [Candidatus Brachybacterium merdigallinarum]|jgi:hypothetical protein|nr:hypothetical protein [Candidatus Brachybacterium merdigallinarum]